MSAVEIRDLSKSFSNHPILKNINLKVENGEFLVLVGPSGCGKSTLLRTIAGLETPNSGKIFLSDKDITHFEPRERDVAMVFQNYALYPHMNVYENIAFGLKVRKLDPAEVDSRVKKTAALLKIEKLLERKPKELSGGQRQRVALGRSLARQAPVILFDEPLSNLDAHLRQEMRVEIKKLHQQFKNTVVYVTHDQSEALTLGHRIVVLNEGHVEQVATPEELYSRPQNLFVARFIGSPEMNLIEGEIKGGQFTSKDLTAPMPSNADGPVTLGVRPEDIRLGDKGFPVKIHFYENHGSYGLFHCKLGETDIMVMGSAENLQFKNPHIDFNLTKIHLFDRSTGLRRN
jgi:ABC-type sugar transport system ATPase subunit